MESIVTAWMVDLDAVPVGGVAIHGAQIRRAEIVRLRQRWLPSAQVRSTQRLLRNCRLRPVAALAVWAAALVANRADSADSALGTATRLMRVIDAPAEAATDL